MSRFFEITTANGTTKLTAEDLPLRIGKTPDSHIIVDSASADLCLIGASKGHLFLQPVEDELEDIDIFHNDEQVNASVWIKSGDISRIGNLRISYHISGDLVGITVDTDTTPKPVSTAASSPALTPPTTAHSHLPRLAANEQSKKKISKKTKIIASIFTFLLITTITLLLTKSFDIEVTPLPDEISISGLPPVFKVGKTFLAVKGQYTVQAQKAGYSDLRQTIKLSHGKNNFSFVLSPLPGRIEFTSTPELNAIIAVDGVNIGTSPRRDIKISAGAHNVQVSKERYRTINQQIEVAGFDQRQSFDFTLQPAWGDVTLISKPPGAMISVDNRQSQQITPATIELMEGKHTIGLSMAKFQPAEFSLTVIAGSALAPPPIELKPALAIIAITSRPSGAAVTIDRTFIGNTPLQQKILSQKPHTITVSAPGHKTASQKIELDAAQSKSINLSLQPEYGTLFISREPANSEIFIDGKRQDQEKNRFQILAMPHSIEVRAKGYKPQTKRLTPLVGSSQVLDFRLQPVNSTHGKTAAPGRNLILLPPSRFTMGASRREQGRRSNEIKREINLSRYFYIAAKEVTNGEYRQFKKDHTSENIAGHSINGDKQPAVNISWQEAVAYLNWLSLQDDLTPFYQIENSQVTISKPLTNGYRLPFEAEWAYAARFAKRQQAAKYPWQGSFPPPDNSGNFADESARGLLPVIIKGYNDSFAMSSPVASFTANMAGFFDMGGNVSEWCHDFYDPTSRSAGKIETDPMGPPTGTHHVVRGASWRDSAVTELRLSYRGYSRKAQDDLGFRIARYAK